MSEDEGRRDVSGIENTAEQSLARLKTQLERASGIYPTDQLDGAAKALEAVIQFLTALDIKQRSPLVHLLAALAGLSEGCPPKWIKPENAKGGNFLSHEDRAFRARVVGTIEFLTGTGLTNRKAIERAASVIGQRPDVVRKWQERLLKSNSDNFNADGIAANYKKSLKERTAEMSGEAAANFACVVLKEAARTR